MATSLDNLKDIILSDEEDDVADYASYTDERSNCNIRLKSGIDLQHLLDEKGVLFEPEDPEPLEEETSGRRYFDMGEEELDEILKNQSEGLNENDDDPNNDLTLFQKKAKIMINLTEDGFVKKKVLNPGLECDGIVPEKAVIVLHYTCCIEDQDEPFDSTYIRGRPERHRLGVGSLLPGLEIAIHSMKKKEKSEYLIDPVLGFGVLGCPPRIPGNSQILARIELLDFAEDGEIEAMLAIAPEERSKQYNFDQVIEMVRKVHNEGNSHVKQNEYKLAAKCYDNGVKLLEDVGLANDDQEAIQSRLLKKLLANKGFCYVRCNWPKKACSALQEAAKIKLQSADQNLSAKIFYRLGQAKMKLGNYQDSMDNFKRAIDLQPHSPDIGRELAHVDKLIKRERDNERALYQKMMNNRHSSRQPVRKTPMKEKFDDESYAEIMDQLEAFKNEKGSSEFTLPNGMESLLNMVESICSELDLTMETVGRAQQERTIIKKPKV